MRKALIYIALEIRAVFLFAINFFSGIGYRTFGVPKCLLRISVFAFIFLSTLNFESYAQSRGQNCPPGERKCRGTCRPARDCRQGVPPPPGLPIDSKLPLLLIAGLGLGIYYYRAKKVA